MPRQRRRDNRSRSRHILWFFTKNNPPDPEPVHRKILIQILDVDSQAYAFQLERGEGAGGGAGAAAAALHGLAVLHAANADRPVGRRDASEPAVRDGRRGQAADAPEEAAEDPARPGVHPGAGQDEAASGGGGLRGDGRPGVRQAPNALPEQQGGTPHWQGCIKFRGGKTFKSIREWAQGGPLDAAHFEPCRSWKHAWAYCTKEATRIDGPWTRGQAPALARAPVDHFIEEDCPEWQRHVLRTVRGPPQRRKVHWVWSTSGGIGKSTLARHLVGFEFRGRSICVRGKCSDVLFGISQFLNENDDLWLVIVDVPRCNEGAVSYQALEDVKNGMFFSPKYESTMALFADVHIVVFANEPPNFNKMSLDRWDVIRADEPAPVPPQGAPPAAYDIFSVLN